VATSSAPPAASQPPAVWPCISTNHPAPSPAPAPAPAPPTPTVPTAPLARLAARGSQCSQGSFRCIPMRPMRPHAAPCSPMQPHAAPCGPNQPAPLPSWSWSIGAPYGPRRSIGPLIGAISLPIDWPIGTRLDLLGSHRKAVETVPVLRAAPEPGPVAEEEGGADRAQWTWAPALPRGAWGMGPLGLSAQPPAS
jgi:hypothetical protein